METLLLQPKVVLKLRALALIAFHALSIKLQVAERRRKKIIRTSEAAESSRAEASVLPAVCRWSRFIDPTLPCHFIPTKPILIKFLLLSKECPFFALQPASNKFVVAFLVASLSNGTISAHKTTRAEALKGLSIFTIAWLLLRTIKSNQRLCFSNAPACFLHFQNK